MNRVWVIGRQKADIANTLHLRYVAMATGFWRLMGYNFGCMIASNTLFDSSYQMKAVDFEVLRDVGMATIFFAFYISSIALILHSYFYHLLVIIWFYSYVLIL